MCDFFCGLSGVGLCFWEGNAPKLVSTLPKIAYHILIVTINASSQTGRVTDIYFKYIERSATPNTIGLIPLEKFREIELRAALRSFGGKSLQTNPKRFLGFGQFEYLCT